MKASLNCLKKRLSTKQGRITKLEQSVKYFKNKAMTLEQANRILQKALR